MNDESLSERILKIVNLIDRGVVSEHEALVRIIVLACETKEN